MHTEIHTIKEVKTEPHFWLLTGDPITYDQGVVIDAVRIKRSKKGPLLALIMFPLQNQRWAQNIYT